MGENAPPKLELILKGSRDDWPKGSKERNQQALEICVK